MAISSRARKRLAQRKQRLRELASPQEPQGANLASEVTTLAVSPVLKDKENQRILMDYLIRTTPTYDASAVSAAKSACRCCDE